MSVYLLFSIFVFLLQRYISTCITFLLTEELLLTFHAKWSVRHKVQVIFMETVRNWIDDLNVTCIISVKFHRHITYTDKRKQSINT